MRYQTYRGEDLVAETDHAELAITGAASVNAPLRVLDTWTGAELSYTVPPRILSVTDDNPHGLPLGFLKYELVKYVNGVQTGSPKIPLIKLVRELTGMGLSEAKSVMDRLEADVRSEERERRRTLKETDPDEYERRLALARIDKSTNDTID